jgi:two-component system NtrC family sensor kinase
MAAKQVLLLFKDQALQDVIARAVLQPAGYRVHNSSSAETAVQLARKILPHCILLEAKLDEPDFPLIRQLKRQHPATPLLLFTTQITLEKSLAALRAGADDILTPPMKTQVVLQAVQAALTRQEEFQDWTTLETRRNTQSLQRRLDELDALSRVGRSVTASLDIDSILSTVVESAVELTGADEGSLLLLDRESGELYIRAAKNIGEEIAHTFRMPVDDSLAGEVIRSGEPLLYSGDSPQKIQTAYFVQSLMYVPLRSHSETIGVLSIHNRQKKDPFSESQLTLVSAIADYAAIAIENARLFDNTEVERRKLNAILTKVVDGVIVVDHEQNLLLMNPTACAAFNVQSEVAAGQKINQLVHHPDLLRIFDLKPSFFPLRREVVLEDGRVFNIQATDIPEVGLVLTMQDITQIKEMDRLKSDFVNAVSHDLRSPLTAIMGYVELLERVGPLNETQREFIQRVTLSVQNVTGLINELLDLGRIEAGFDTQKEMFALEHLVNLTIEELRELAESKNQALIVEIAPNLPPIYASPTRIQQVLNNLIGNAIKYTQVGGWVRVNLHTEDRQFILQVSDNGPGIPVSEQPYIFDRFYRATNATQATGTGLGLAIVKSIVENHQGRIWVDSVPGQGATFTVVLSQKKPPEKPLSRQPEQWEKASLE